MQKSLKWSPAQPQRKPDNIVSSKARERGDLTGFIPSYLSEPKEDMKFIMSNEYMRKWYKERNAYEKDTYSREQIIKEESKIKRRFVQRMMTYKKPKKFELLEEIFHTNSQEKSADKQMAVDYTKFKYKPVCPKPKQQAPTDENIGGKSKGSKTSKKPRSKKQAPLDRNEGVDKRQEEDGKQCGMMLCPLAMKDACIQCCP